MVCRRALYPGLIEETPKDLKILHQQKHYPQGLRREREDTWKTCQASSSATGHRQVKPLTCHVLLPFLERKNDPGRRCELQRLTECAQLDFTILLYFLVPH
jgi:hypothetical protein